MKMNSDVKHAVIVRMLHAGYDNDGVFSYIIKNFTRFFVYLLKTGDVETVQKIIDNGTLLTKRNIDKQIQAAHDAGQHEIQTMLLNYKNEHFGFDDPLKQFKL